MPVSFSQSKLPIGYSPKFFKFSSVASSLHGDHNDGAGRLLGQSSEPAWPSGKALGW